MASRKPLESTINHPTHYTQGTIECIDAIESALGFQGFVAFLRGQVLRYTWRCTYKNAPLEDAMKCQWYQDRLVKTLKAYEESH